MQNTKTTHLINYARAACRANLSSTLAAGKAAWVPPLFMFLQNLIFILLWVVFFEHVGSLRGWTIDQMLILTAILSFSFGSSLFICGGAFHLSEMIESGGLDNLLCRPGSVLVSCLFSHMRVSGFGDMCTGLLLFSIAAGADIGAWALFALSVIAGSILMLSCILMIQSLSFWKGGSSGLSDALFEFLIILSHQPQHGFPALAKVIIFTIFPVGFMSLLPVTMISEMNLIFLLPIFAASAFFAWLAVKTFYKGLENYKSGSFMGKGLL